METIKLTTGADYFVKTYLPFAKQSEALTGISAVFTLAQGGTESAWGAKTTGNFNFFGIKADASWKGDIKTNVTHEFVNGKWIVINANFRSYANAADGFTDHAQFFLTNKRYAKALLVKNNANLFADAVAIAGYATDPNYNTTLKGVIKSVISRLPS